VSAQSIVLGFANRADAQPIALMSRDLIEAGIGWEYRPKRIAALIRDPDTVTVVARESDRLVGFAVMTFADERAHLVLLAVHEQDQRRGVGRRLLGWLLESALVAGTASVHVELRDRNNAGIGFYDALGFAETFRMAGYYGGRETAIRMVRILRAPGTSLPAWNPPKSGKS
jgi:[ribosomal protein S18]-alanine N-acetyltransferase